MTYRSLFSFLVLPIFGALVFSLPLSAQVTLSNSTQPPHVHREDGEPQEVEVEQNPFTRTSAPSDSPSVQDSSELLTGAVTPSYSPHVLFPSGISYEIFGNDAPAFKKFDCHTVLFGIPSYQNAQAQGACYEAQTACVRFGLIQQFLTKAKQKQLSSKYPGSTLPKEDLEEILTSSLREVRLKLTGCVVAIAASTITDSVIDQAGFPPPKESEDSAANSPQPGALQ